MENIFYNWKKYCGGNGVESMKDGKYNIDDLKRIMDRLMAEDGCPWDRVQTHRTIKQYMIEECYEALDAIDSGDEADLCEELGDILLQVVQHIKIAEKEGEFCFDDVTDVVSRKMINRHRHVFGLDKTETPEAVLNNWDRIKKEEKNYASTTDVLRRIPKSFPALIRTQKLLKKAYKSEIVNPGTNGELIDEFNVKTESVKEALKGNIGDKNKVFGDIMLLLTKISIFLQINAEFSLTNALETYINEFEEIEKANK